MTAIAITLDATAGTATMSGGRWVQVVPIADLPAQLKLYRGLWARGGPVVKAGKPLRPGPWAKFYEADIRAIEGGIRQAAELKHDRV